MSTPISIELKSIRTTPSMSRETTAYSAKLWVDGEFVAVVGNDGGGGCDIVVGPGRSKDYGAALRAYDEACRRVAAEHPMVDLADAGETPSMTPDSLEYMCARIVGRHDELKGLRRRMKRSLLVFENGLPADGARSAVHSWSIPSPERTDALRSHVVAKHPQALILNDLDDDALMTAFDRAD